MEDTPTFSSLAFDDIPAPDYADVIIAILPEGSATDPAAWARTIFSTTSMPVWVKVALGFRQLLAPLIGIPKAKRNIFSVSKVAGDEALISVNDRHLNFRCAVGVDAERRLVRVTTTVALKGWRGRVYFWPVRLVHPTVVHAMLTRAQRRMGSIGSAPDQFVK